jgi:hypothetical protein
VVQAGWSNALVMAAAVPSHKDVVNTKSDGRTRQVIVADTIAALMIQVQQTLL